MNDRIEIPLSKARLLLNLGGSLMFVVLGIGLITTIAYDQTKLPPIMVQIVGVASILFFGMTMYGITINALSLNYNFKALEKLVVERFENFRPNP